MAKVKIVTDSTAYLPPELITRYGIEVVPLKVLFGPEAYTEGVDISNEEFYRKLAKASTLPTTSQPSIGDFVQVYDKAAREAAPILSIHISSKLSATVNSALNAKDELPQAQIEVVDSLSGCMGLGMIVLAAARAAEEGQALSQIRASIERLIKGMHLFFLVDTLEYLHKGGRIGGAATLLGTALRIKPILCVKDGQIEALARVRTKRKAVARMLELVEERVQRGAAVHVAVFHAQAADEALALQEEIRARFDCAEMHLSDLGPVIGTHVGPRAVGLAFYTD
ncbi:Protein DegV [subsurface metagenome]